MIKINRALISVSDKEGVVEFAAALKERGIEIISTGGTAKTLNKNGIPVVPVSEVTGAPEILGGRVKTLHPKIHGAILSRDDNESDKQTLESQDIQPIELIVVNLYPFEETISDQNVRVNEAIEQIDIGGPTMIRAAAKNFRYRAVVVNPDRYPAILKELDENDRSLSENTLLSLAHEAFQSIAHYDAVIAGYFKTLTRDRVELPPVFTISHHKEMTLRYGENPHQKAGLYGHFFRHFQQIHGKELSYNNILDINAAVNLVSEFEKPSVAIIKHNNPCGVASSSRLSDAYKKAFRCDQTSAFGGIVAVNRPLDIETAKMVNEIFTEVIVAPEFEEGVLELLIKKKDRRIMKQLSDVREISDPDLRNVAGGFLLQERDTGNIRKEDFKVVTNRKPDDREIDSLLFAWRVSKHVKSNAIIFVRNEYTVGIGAGQMSRIDSSKIAVKKAQEAGLDLSGTVAASDGFFPFPDGVIELARAGAVAVIQPGGSVRDQEVIDAADKNEISMVFTGMRHFRH